MKQIGSQKGMALFELLVALAIFGLIASLSIPNITFDSNKDSVYKSAQEIRFALQDVMNESWLDGKSFQLMLTDNTSWMLLSLHADEWKKDGHIFENIGDVSLSLLSEGDSNQVYFLSSGEYTPFKIAINKGDYSAMVIGDGVNDLEIK